MQTWEEFARQARAWGFSPDEARREWELQASHERARQVQAARAKAETENPPPGAAVTSQ